MFRNDETPDRRDVVLMNKLFDGFMDAAQRVAQGYPEGHPTRTEISDVMQTLMPLGVRLKTLLTKL
jgi:hypothetical protein